MLSPQNVLAYDVQWTEYLFSVSSEEKDGKLNIIVFNCGS